MEGIPDKQSRQRTEYSAQHFRCTPDALIETLNDIVHKEIEELLQVSKDKCGENFPKVSQQELDKSFSILEER